MDSDLDVALKHIKYLEVCNDELGNLIEDAYDTQDVIMEQLKFAQESTDYWVDLWERSSTMLMQYHPAFNGATEVTTEGKLWVIKELLGDNLPEKVTFEGDTKDER